MKKFSAAGIALLTYCALSLTGAEPFEQIAYLKASNPGRLDNFGAAAAVSGDTIVIGALSESSPASGVNGSQGDGRPGAGAAYVFVRHGTNWFQQAYLKASNPGSADAFGCAVAISGDVIVVGARFEDSNAAGVNGDQTNNLATDSGAAYVFVRNGTNWSQQAYLKASNPEADDWFGASVAVSGDTVVIGAANEAGSSSGINSPQEPNGAPLAGATYVFVRSGTNWSQQAYLKASNCEAGDKFGFSVSIDDETVVVGALDEDGTVTGVNGVPGDISTDFHSGAAYVFVRTGTNWIQQAYLKASNTGISDTFGYSVSISGDTVVVGARLEDSSSRGVNGDGSNNSAPDAGAGYVFRRTGTNWFQEAYLKASNAERDDWFGESVAVSGNIVVIGARIEDGNSVGVNGDQDDNSGLAAGAAYVFVRSGTNWSQSAYLKAATPRSVGDYFGLQVAVDDGLVVVGAYNDRSAAAGVNGDPYDTSMQGAGAAFVFTPPAVVPKLDIQMNASGEVWITGTATPGKSYRSEVSFDLNGPWAFRSIVTASSNGVVEIRATNETGHAFFRLVLEP